MLESTLAEIDSRTLLLFKKVKVNVTTDLKQKNIISLAYKVYSMSYINGNKKLTRQNRIWKLKKILFVIGLLKNILTNPKNLYEKNRIELKLSLVLYTLDEIVVNYDIRYDNIIEISDNIAIEYYNYINSLERSNIGITVANKKCKGLIKKLQKINFLESSQEIKTAEFLYIYLNLTFISKTFNDCLKIIESKDNELLFKKTIQDLEETNKFIFFLISNFTIIRNFSQSNDLTKFNIIKEQNFNFFKAILD